MEYCTYISVSIMTSMYIILFIRTNSKEINAFSNCPVITQFFFRFHEMNMMSFKILKSKILDKFW